MVNMFVEGEWVADYDETNDDGEFQREETTFRDWVGEDGDYPPDAGRYHLYVSYACPWAHRTLITRAVMGLKDVITVDVVDPWRGADGWQFTPEKDGCTPDTANGFEYLREAYVAADPDYTGRVTVPVLWDKKEDTIVNNESREIMRMLTTAFEDHASPSVELSPADAREQIDRYLDYIYEPINNGVYRAGFAGRQEAYDAAVEALFDALDHWDVELADRRYMVDDRLTEADVAMYTTLVRFDHVYHTHFKCDRRFIHQYDNLWPYLRDLYQTPGFGGTTRMDHIKEHYYTTHGDLNPRGIIATGPAVDFEAAHDREGLQDRPETRPDAA